MNQGYGVQYALLRLTVAYWTVLAAASKCKEILEAAAESHISILGLTVDKVEEQNSSQIIPVTPKDTRTITKLLLSVADSKLAYHVVPL